MKLIIHHNSIWNKGGAGSGFHGHAGRPGLVGGSQANTSAVRADMISVNELDVITHDDIKSYLDYVKEGTGEENFRYRYEHEFFLGPDGKIYSMNNPVFNGHEQIAKNIIEKKKLDINPYKEDEELAVLNRGYIRMAYAPGNREIIIEAIPFRTTQLRMVQDKMLGLNSIVDSVRIDRFRYKVPDGAEKYIRSNDFSYDDFMTSNDVVLVDDEPVRLKEKKAKLRYKGGAGSGFHGHRGRPGQVGGSISESSAPHVAQTLNLRRYREQVSTKIYDVLGGGNINSSDINMIVVDDYGELPRKLPVRVIYNAETNTWYIPDNNFADHADFQGVATPGVPDYKGNPWETYSDAGYLDVEKGRLYMYDHTASIQHYINAGVTLSPQTLEHKINRVMKKASNNVFTLDGKDIVVTFIPDDSDAWGMFRLE